ncbi:MAG: DUF6285 domain-containing protein [Pseudomonadota bacterium]|nr:DUF6285 domain-containing protein [Pseudomonadota bacterium]
MTDIADAADLLATAREAFVSELLPALSKEHRYVGLMIANVMAIAARECRLGHDAAQSEVARLRRMMADIGGPISPPDDLASQDLAALRQSVSAAIRAGHFDDPAREKAVTAELLHVVADWVAISNPKALRAWYANP